MPETEHDFGSRDCWCGPRVRIICPRCEPEPRSVTHPTKEKAVLSMAEDADPDCWQCGGEGLLDREPTPWEVREEEALLIVHHYDA